MKNSIKDVFIRLLEEVYPLSAPIFNDTTAEQMIEEIRNETDLGKNYLSDVLRVSRDLLARQAEKYMRK